MSSQTCTRIAQKRFKIKILVSPSSLHQITPFFFPSISEYTFRNKVCGHMPTNRHNSKQCSFEIFKFHCFCTFFVLIFTKFNERYIPNTGNQMRSFECSFEANLWPRSSDQHQNGDPVMNVCGLPVPSRETLDHLGECTVCCGWWRPRGDIENNNGSFHSYPLVKHITPYLAN